jgi:predicted dehydrogenase
MTVLSRRSWIQSAAAGGLAAVSAASYARAAGANRRVRVATIGLGGRGRGHIRDWQELPDVEVGGVCDVDPAQIEATHKLHGGLKSFTDLRAVLDDKSIDAVYIATPDHWHTPAALLALEAGKHVYVEKPCSHNLREGQALVDAARKHRLCVQHGTQSRSSPFLTDAVRLLREGLIGDVLVAKAWNVQRRRDIGRAKPSAPPAGVDYDTWVGPAPETPFQSNRFHHDWRWWYQFGTGDMGNDGVHDLDVARWGLGVSTPPTTIMSIGGKCFYDDDQQFPDTQTAVFEFAGDGPNGGKRQLIFEMRLWTRVSPFNSDNCCEFHGTKGTMVLGKAGKIQVWDGDKRLIPAEQLPQPTKLSTVDHMRNFVDAVRDGAPLNAEIEIGFQSSALAHLGTIAARLGRSLKFDPAKREITGDAEANKLLGREYRPKHWGTPKGLA